MDEVSIIGLDLAKNVFQVHEAGRDGRTVLRKKLNRSRLLEFFVKLPRCVVAMELAPAPIIGDGRLVRLATISG